MATELKKILGQSVENQNMSKTKILTLGELLTAKKLLIIYEFSPINPHNKPWVELEPKLNSWWRGFENHCQQANKSCFKNIFGGLVLKNYKWWMIDYWEFIWIIYLFYSNKI